MNINGVNGLNGVSNINQTSAINRNNGSENTTTNVQADRSEISGANKVDVKSDMDPNGIRFELVNRVREQIAAGTYFSEAKLNTAISNMLKSLPKTAE